MIRFPAAEQPKGGFSLVELKNVSVTYGSTGVEALFLTILDDAETISIENIIVIIGT